MQGILTQDTTIAATGTPHLIYGDIVVPTAVTLTIAPGAEIQFVPGDNMRGHRDPERIEIVVHGTLVVGDSEGAPVTLSASAANAQSAKYDAWYGIRMEPGASLTQFENVQMKNALQGLEVRGAGTFLSLIHI